MNSKSTMTFILLLLNNMLSTISENLNNEIKIWKLPSKTKFMRSLIKIGTHGFSAHQECFYLPRNYKALKKSGPLELLIKVVL